MRPGAGPRAALVLACATALMLSAVSAEAIPAFARQFDLQCGACHTVPPRLNSFGEQVHMMGFQVPSAGRPGGVLASFREDGALKTILDSLALRVEGGLFEWTESRHESEKTFAPPDEITLYVARALTPELSIFVEIEGVPKSLEFEDGRFRKRGEVGLGHEAFFMLNLGRVLGWLGAPTMEMGGMTMVGEHGGFNLHGPMLMAGKIDPSTNFSYPTHRQLILETDAEVEGGRIERLPIVPYALASKFFGLFREHRDREPQLVTDQVSYNTLGEPGADFHAMLGNNLIVGQTGVLRENDGFTTYLMGRVNLGERDARAFNLSALVAYGIGTAATPDPLDRDRPDKSVDRLRYGVAANTRLGRWDVYGALLWDQLVDVPSRLRGFDRSAAGLTLEVDYLASETIVLSTRFDQLWAGGFEDQKADGSVLSFQLRYHPWPNVGFFVRDSVNLRSEQDENPLRNWRNQLIVGIDWDF